jgi:hypothetical protein
MASAGIAGRQWLPVAVPLASLVLLVGPLLYFCGRPLDTNDLWWHLKMGEVYATEGPWPESDPLLHTAHENAPVQHEWLFGVAVHGIQRAFGFHGLRVAHVLAVAGILGLAYSIFRRASASLAAASVATSCFVVLAFWRLIQLRPDLVSIPATLLLYRLLLEGDGPPSWKRVWASAALFAVWANAHSLFAVGLLLLVAALVGCALRAGLTRGVMPGGTLAVANAGSERPLARRLGAALGLDMLATLANPRGIEQHLTFLASSRDAGIWRLGDEWSHFDPFAWSSYGAALSFPAWLLMDVLFALFAFAALLGLVRFVRRRSAPSLEAFDPLHLALGAASVTAILVSIRFLWMAVFPLIYLLRAQRPALAARPDTGRTAAWAFAAAGAALAVSFSFVKAGGFRQVATQAPRSFSAYLAQAYDADKFYVEGMRFLRETGVQGNLFNKYAMGGFIGYWLAPHLRTFIDGRYPTAELLSEYFRINRQQQVRPGESSLEALERRQVDLFFGVGWPRAGSTQETRLYTAANLERAPGWILVSRSRRHAIYLRANERNRENLRRISEYYAREGVPFDPERGLDVAALIAGRPDWAVAHDMIPPHHARLEAQRNSADPELRYHALAAFGKAYARVGAYEEQIAMDRDAIVLRPSAKPPRRRLVYGLLRLDRPAEALEAAEALERLDPGDRRSAAFGKVARRYAEQRRKFPEGHEARARVPLDAPINRLAVLGRANDR